MTRRISYTDEKFKECQDKIVENEQGVIKGTGWGYRHQQTLLLFFCMVIAYCLRSCMGVAMVGMTMSLRHNTSADANVTVGTNGTETLAEENVTNQYGTGANVSNYYSHYDKNGFPLFSWEKSTQDLIQSGFFWGYMALQVPSGQLAHWFGAKILLTTALLVNGLIAVCLPWGGLYGGWKMVLVSRLLMGLSQSCMVPACHTFLGKWAPLSERCRLSAYVYGSNALGTVIGLPLTGYIAASSIGWPGIFVTYGLVALVLGIIMAFFFAESPDSHPKITREEKIYIEEGLGQKNTEDSPKKRLPVPWKKILTHRGVWAIIIAHTGNSFGAVMLWTQIPSYMANVMDLTIKKIGVLMALPFFAMWLANFFFSWMSDKLIVHKIFSVTHTRKLVNTIGSVIPAAGFILLGYLPNNIYIVEATLIVIVAIKIAQHSGFQVNHIDISPNFAGTLMSMSNFVSNLAGSFVPVTATYIVTDSTDQQLWCKMFIISASFFLVCNLLFVVLGTSEKADWNEPLEDETNKDEEMAMIEKLKQIDIEK